MNFFFIRKRGNEGRMLLCWSVLPLQLLVRNVATDDLKSWRMRLRPFVMFRPQQLQSVLLLYQLTIWRQNSEEWLNRTERKKRHQYLKKVPCVSHLKNSGTVSHFVYFSIFVLCQNSSGPHTSSAVQRDHFFSNLLLRVYVAWSHNVKKKTKKTPQTKKLNTRTLMLFTEH